MSGVKRQLSLSLGFGQESGSSAPLEKRPAVDFKCAEASEATQCQSQSDPAGSLTSEATESRSRTGESRASAESVLPISSFEDLSPPYNIGEVYNIAKNLIMKCTESKLCMSLCYNTLLVIICILLTDLK